MPLITNKTAKDIHGESVRHPLKDQKKNAKAEFLKPKKKELGTIVEPPVVQAETTEEHNDLWDTLAAIVYDIPADDQTSQEILVDNVPQQTTANLVNETIYEREDNVVSWTNKIGLAELPNDVTIRRALVDLLYDADLLELLAEISEADSDPSIRERALDYLKR